jgi:hypothetical protein
LSSQPPHRAYSELLGQSPPARQQELHVVINKPVNWQQWYDFHQAVIQPLAEARAETRLDLLPDKSGRPAVPAAWSI